jgi:hypothetical protein
MIEVHLSNGGGALRLQRVGIGYYQVVYTNQTGETRRSPLFQDGGAAVKWAISLMKRIAQEAASPSKVG